MINAEQLNETIGELEKELQNIKSISKIYEEISKLSDELKVNKELHGVVVREITKVSGEIGVTSKSLINSVDNLNKVIEDIEINVDENLIDIKEENKKATKRLMEGYKQYELDVSAKLSDSASKLNKQYEGYAEKIDIKFEILNKEYIERIAEIKEVIDINADKLSKDIMVQLDKNERVISTEIKNLNYEIQNSLMNYITSKSEILERKLEVKEKDDKANAKMFKVFICISIFLSIVSVLVCFFK